MRSTRAGSRPNAETPPPSAPRPPVRPSRPPPPAKAPCSRPGPAPPRLRGVLRPDGRLSVVPRHAGALRQVLRVRELRASGLKVVCVERPGACRQNGHKTPTSPIRQGRRPRLDHLGTIDSRDRPVRRMGVRAATVGAPPTGLRAPHPRGRCPSSRRRLHRRRAPSAWPAFPCGARRLVPLESLWGAVRRSSLSALVRRGHR